jgi:hypothetical protein
LNADANGSPTENAGIEVNRGTSANASIRWRPLIDGNCLQTQRHSSTLRQQTMLQARPLLAIQLMRTRSFTPTQQQHLHTATPKRLLSNRYPAICHYLEAHLLATSHSQDLLLWPTGPSEQAGKYYPQTETVAFTGRPRRRAEAAAL